MAVVLRWLIVDAQSEPAVPLSGEPWWQYGAIGGGLALALYAVYKLFNILVAEHKAQMEQLKDAHRAEIERIEAANQAAIERADAAYRAEGARADRMEAGLRDLNQLVRDSVAGALANATDAIREALEMQRDRRRQ